MTHPEGVRLLSLQDAPFAGATGDGVRVAIIDSGVTAGHPHVGAVLNGVRIGADGEDAEYSDRVGHGTAVAGAIREKVPDAELLAVRVFDRELTTTAGILARAIEWAVLHKAQIINVSLGTPNAAHAERLAAAVQLADEAGALVVAAATNAGRPVWPGALPSVVAVEAAWDVPRDVIRVGDRPDGSLLLWASAFPRPISGVPAERNLQGVSFAVANATGFLARFRQANADARSIAQVREALTRG